MNHKDMTKKSFSWGLAIILIVLLFYWLFKPQPIEVDAVAVSSGSFVQTIQEDGKTRPKEVYKIIAPIQGELLRVKQEAGDTVKKNQVLASMVPSRSTLLDVRSKKILQAF